MNVGFTGLSPRSWEWVHSKVHADLTQRTKGVVAFDRDTSNILAVVVWDSWTVTSAMSHIAIDDSRVIEAGFVHECFEYFFNTTDRQIMLTSVSSKNVDCLKFVTAVGFKEICRVKDGLNVGEDIVVHEMRKDDCRWLRNGKAESARSA